MQARSVRLPFVQAYARVVASLAVFLQPLLPALPASAVPNHPGRWTAAWKPEPISIAVNLVLLPGAPSGHHSRVLMWDHDNDSPVAGRILGWDAPDDGLTNTGAFPVASFPNLSLEDPPTQCVNGAATNIFCAGATHMADGRLFVSGGTDLGESGLRSALIFDPAADSNGNWVLADTMKYRRWYPDNTLLPDGRLLTVAGSYAVGMQLVGGLVDASPLDSATRLVQRFPVGRGGVWEDAVVPRKTSDQSPLEPFSQATGIGLGSSDVLVYGGKDLNSQPINKARYVFRERNEYGADYSFKWRDLTQVERTPGEGLPPALTGAALVQLDASNDILLIGGMDGFGVAHAELYRGVLNDARTSITWNHMATTLPVALHGASAVYERSLQRVFVFGGSGNSGELATNSTMYSIALDLGNAGAETATIMAVTQSAPTAGESIPQARAYGTLTMDPIKRAGLPSTPAFAGEYGRALLFGGRAADNSLPSDLYAAWFKDATTVEWKRITPDPGPAPTGRTHHAAISDPNSQWLVVSGGEVAAGTSSSEMWAFDLGCEYGGCNSNGSNHWDQLGSLPKPVRDHVAAWVGSEPLFSRIPEVYDPRLAEGCGAPYSWTGLESSPHFQEWFSFGMVAPRKAGGSSSDSVRVFFSGPESPSAMLHLGRVPPRWEKLTASASGDYPSAGAAVMYRPGRIMKAGTRDTGPDTARGTTAVINLTDDNPVWVKAAAADGMIPRKNHNLVLLPTGDVLAVGGGRIGGADKGSTDANCVFMPQVWNPDTLLAGHWYGQETDPGALRFAESTVRRFYHGSAVLLPDGRILSAGGAFDTMATRLDLYSPWYLFGANGVPATRPVIQGAPPGVAYGERFPVCMSAAAPLPARFTLVRPGAATHGFDQNQRFMALTTLSGPLGTGSERHYVVSAPADPFDAPPGDYMLFALTAAGTPAIARWVRLGERNGSVSQPATIGNLAKICTNGTSVDLQWSPPAADVGSACPGPATVYEMQYLPGMTFADTDWGSPAATLVTGLPLPDDPATATWQAFTVTGLTAGQWYTFRMRSKNMASALGNWSPLSNALTVHTIAEECGGAGGGGGGGGFEDGGYSSRRIAGGSWVRRTGGGGGAADPRYLENTLLPGLATGVVATDRVRLPFGPLADAAGVSVRLSRTGVRGTRFTAVRLRGVALAEGQMAFADGDGVSVGTLVEPVRVMHADGRDLTASLAADTAFDCVPGDTLYAEFAEGTPGRLALSTSRASLVLPPERTGFDVQVEQSGVWGTVSHHEVRERRADALVPLPGMARVRLIALGPHRLHGLARFVPGAAGEQVVVEPATLRHSQAGEVTAEFAISGAELSRGQSLLATFALTPEQLAGRDWFLEVTGQHTTLSGAAAASWREAAAEAPLRFALEPSRPNPFAGSTSLAFTLAERADVRLEVFDLLGRRIVTLASGVHAPGRHTVAWDRRSVAGSRVAPGIYTCRLIAGEHRAQQRIIAMP